MAEQCAVSASTSLTPVGGSVLLVLALQKGKLYFLCVCGLFNDFDHKFGELRILDVFSAIP